MRTGSTVFFRMRIRAPSIPFKLNVNELYIFFIIKFCLQFSLSSTIHDEFVEQVTGQNS